MNSENTSNNFINNNFNFNMHPHNNIYFKDLCSTDLLPDNCCISDINSILEIKLNIEIYDCTILNTSYGQKIVIKGFKLYKLYYSAPEKRDLVFCKNFNIPFFESISVNTCQEVAICGVSAIVVCCDAIKEPCKEIYLSSMVCFKIAVNDIKDIDFNISLNANYCKDDCSCNNLDDEEIDF